MTNVIPARRLAGRWLEPICVVLLSFLALGGFEYLVLSAGEDSRRYLNETGRLAFATARLGLSAVVVLMVLGSSDFRDTLRHYWPGMALVLFSCASYFWSVDVDATAGGLVRLVAVFAIGIWLARDGRPDQIMHRLGLAAVTFITVNLIATVTFPELSFMRGMHEGAWRGALSHKNALGLNLTFAGIVLFCRFLDTGRLRSLGLYCICWVGIAMSQSASAIVVSGVGLGMVLTLWLMTTMVRRTYLPSLLLACTALCLVSVPWILQLSEAVSTGVGRDATFTGRTTIWRYALVAAERGGLFGYGYQAFWSDLQSLGGIYRNRDASWSPVHAHNGLLDAWLAGGGFGLVLAMFVLLLALKRGYAMTSHFGPIGTRLFPLTAATCLAVYNMFETVFPSSSTLAFSLIAVVLGMRPRRGSP